MKNRLQNYCSGQNQSESEGNSSGTIPTFQKPAYNQNSNSPLSKTSPHPILQQPLSSPKSNLLHNPDHNGANANSANNTPNPSIETTEEHNSDLTSKFQVQRKR